MDQFYQHDAITIAQVAVMKLYRTVVVKMRAEFEEGWFYP